MLIRELTASQLKEFIYSDEYQKMKVVPISKHRALSHINNPRVAPDDVIMLIAYIDEVMVGYLGVFADQIHFHGATDKAGWLSCMWVDPAIRGKGIAKQLLNRALETWQQRILVTEFTVAAKGLYDKSGAFMDLQVKDGIRGYLRFDFNQILIRRKPSLIKVEKLLKAGDALLNTINNLRLYAWRLMLRSNFNAIEYIKDIDEETAAFIAHNQSNQLFRRSAKDLNWMINNPWVLSGGTLDRDSARYHFSAVDTRFEFIKLKLYDAHGKINGFLILSVRARHLKVPYYYYHPKDVAQVANIIYDHMLSLKLTMITVFDPVLVKYFKENHTPFYIHRSLKRHYIISKAFEEALKSTPDFSILDGDADCAFT